MFDYALLKNAKIVTHESHESHELEKNKILSCQP